MRKSKILAKVRAGQPARLAMMGYFIPAFVAYAAKLGFDGIWLDMEHHNFDDREVQALLAFFHLYDIDCLVRPPTREKPRLYRYLEDGATGLIIPHVNDAETARDLVQSVKFPPVGDRGIHGRGLDANFGLDTKDALVENALKETFVVVQIETPQALAQAEQMAAIPGLDGLYVGPADLGLRLKLQPDGIHVNKAIAQIAAICRQHGKMWGSLAATEEDLILHRDLDATLQVWGVDARILQAGLTQAWADLERVL
ncbi:MAG: 4-hydroxy-2-oxovalerate aldolase [Anaerolineaceae bacterium]|nr:4-hydroxy-2-oxovalerate aldolase [Anaerolineaceae bacterium]